MTLLVDVGNSAIKWAQVSADGTLDVAQRQLHRGAPEVASGLVEKWRGNVSRGAPVIACNVAGAGVVAAVEDAARTLELEPVRWQRSQRRFDGPIVLINGYRDPEQLGTDRWHCMLGAFSWSSVRGETDSLVVVNAGTATTVDCIDAGVARLTGKFIGGVIVPGVRLMLDSLAHETAGLPAASADFLDSAADFPDNTNAAIVTGVLDAQAGVVHRVWHRFAARLKAEPHLVLTGGNAEALLARLSIAADIEHNLVLRGLALRARHELSK